MHICFLCTQCVCRAKRQKIDNILRRKRLWGLRKRVIKDPPLGTVDTLFKITTAYAAVLAWSFVKIVDWKSHGNIAACQALSLVIFSFSFYFLYFCLSAYADRQFRCGQLKSKFLKHLYIGNDALLVIFSYLILFISSISILAGLLYVLPWQTNKVEAPAETGTKQACVCKCCCSQK